MKIMIDIVNELIEIEANANEILTDAQNDKFIFDQVYNLILQQLREKINLLSQNEIENARKENLFLQDEGISQISTKYEEYTAQMENEFASQKDNWIKEIFDSILEDF